MGNFHARHRLGLMTAAWAKSGAPLPYDAEVEWLQSVSTASYRRDKSNTQFIDLLIPVRYSLPISIETNLMINMQYTEARATTCLIGGSTKANVDYRNWILSFPLSSGFTINCALKFNSISQNKITPFVFHNLSVEYAQGNQKVYCDGVRFCNASNTMTLDQSMDGYSLLLGKSYVWETSDGGGELSYEYPLRFKIKDFHIIANGIERDLIAVRFTNENGVSEGAMYDRVSGQLFRNAGTGAFVIGPDK